MLWLWQPACQEGPDRIFQVMPGGVALAKGQIVIAALVPQDSQPVNDKYMGSGLGAVQVSNQLMLVVQKQGELALLGNTPEELGGFVDIRGN